MAIDVISAQDKKIVLVEHSAANFGTAEADTIAGTEFDIDDFNINADFKKREFPGVHGARWLKSEGIQTDVKGATPTFTMNGIVRNSIDHILHAHFQTVTEGIATPWDKTFVWHTTQPDFSANAGSYYTVIEQYPTASRSWKAHSAICSKVTLSVAPGDVLKFSADWIAMGNPTYNANPTGTYTREQGNIWHFEDIDLFTVDFGAGPVNLTLMGYEVTFTQNVVPLSPNGTGSYQSWAVLNKRGTFKFSVLKDANTQTFMTNVEAGTKLTGVRLGWGNAVPGTDDGDFDIQFVAKVEKVIMEGADITMGTIEGSLVDDDGTSPVDLILANGLDRTW